MCDCYPEYITNTCQVCRACEKIKICTYECHYCENDCVFRLLSDRDFMGEELRYTGPSLTEFTSKECRFTPMNDPGNTRKKVERVAQSEVERMRESGELIFDLQTPLDLLDLIKNLPEGLLMNAVSYYKKVFFSRLEQEFPESGECVSCQKFVTIPIMIENVGLRSSSKINYCKSCWDKRPQRQGFLYGLDRPGRCYFGIDYLDFSNPDSECIARSLRREIPLSDKLHLSYLQSVLSLKRRANRLEGDLDREILYERMYQQFDRCVDNCSKEFPQEERPFRGDFEECLLDVMIGDVLSLFRD